MSRAARGRIVWQGVRGNAHAITSHLRRRYTVRRNDDGLGYVVQINRLIGDELIEIVEGFATVRAAKAWAEDEIQRRDAASLAADRGRG
jgi:hypothetical protein